MHNWPGMEAGTFGVCAGPMMAAANGFKITVRGKGGHASAPQDCADPVPALFAIGQAFQTILTRCKRPLDAAVLSITQVQAGGSVINVIPDSAWLGGSVRAYSDEVVGLIERRMHEISGSIAAAHGCEAEVYFQRRYPALVNTRPRRRSAWRWRAKWPAKAAPGSSSRPWRPRTSRSCCRPSPAATYSWATATAITAMPATAWAPACCTTPATTSTTR